MSREAHPLAESRRRFEELALPHLGYLYRLAVRLKGSPQDAEDLVPRKSRVIAEMARVLRPGGRVAIADLVMAERLPEAVLKSPAAWAG